MASLSIISLLVTVFLLYKALAVLVRRSLRAKLTGLDDLSLLAVPRKGAQKICGTAVICGGSIAGLLSARICSDHFENVIVVEPEAWVATEEGLHDRHRQTSSTEPPPKRSRVVQYTSLHVYQPFTPMALRKLFPDFEREVTAEGARFLPWDPNAYLSGVRLIAPFHQYPKDALPNSMFLTRPRYETLLRRLVLSSCSNIKYITGTVTALVPETAAGVISSVRLRTRTEDEQEIPATLVVDCTGPALGGLRWLREAGYGSETKLKADPKGLPLQDLKLTYDHKMAYTTCEFDVPERLHSKLQETGFPYPYKTAGNLYIYFADPKIDCRTLIISRRENDYLQIACGGWDMRDKMANVSDIRGFVADIVSARPMPEWIYAMLDVLEEENVPVTYVYARCPPSVYVRYSRAANLPSNFVAVGDSVLQLNPVRGQGCTKACVDAVTLNAALARCTPVSQKGDTDRLPEDFSRSFFAVQAVRTGGSWESYKAEDYSWKSTTPVPGEDPASVGAWKRAYRSQIVRLALKDRDVAAVLWHTSNWLAPSTDVLSPTILLKIAWMRLRAPFGA